MTTDTHRDRIAPEIVPADAGLRRRYAEYRRREGAALLSLVPRPGVRALYGAAVADGVFEAGAAETVAHDDLLGALAEYCADRLPLPPFEVWVRDFDAHRAAHLESYGAAPRDEPVTVGLRAFTDPTGSTWYAALDVRRSEHDVRGSIVFHRGEGSRTYGTAEVFREPSADAVRARFEDFDDVTLRAFLRSVLP